jgi:hypothetical protein
MPRPKKHKIQNSVESLNHLLQEIYNECVEQRSTAIQQRNKIMKEIENLDDIPMVGKLTTDLLKIIDLAIDKKIALAKLQAALISGGNKIKEENDSYLTTDQIKFLRETMKKIKADETVDFDLEQQNG